jgi:hypothetical protein
MSPATERLFRHGPAEHGTAYEPALRTALAPRLWVRKRVR